MQRAMHGGCNAARELDRLDGIIDDLRRHLAAGGVHWCEYVERLYRDYYSIGPHRETNAAAVRSWAARHATTPT